MEMYFIIKPPLSGYSRNLSVLKCTFVTATYPESEDRQKYVVISLSVLQISAHLLCTPKVHSIRQLQNLVEVSSLLGTKSGCFVLTSL